MRCSGLPNEHHVQDTFVLLPTGTIDRGTPKHDAVGTVLSGSIAHLIRCSPAGEAAFIPCPEGAGPSAPERQRTCIAARNPRPRRGRGPDPNEPLPSPATGPLPPQPDPRS